MPARDDPRLRRLGSMLGCTLAALPTPGHAEGDLGGYLAVTTDYVLRGMSQTRGAAALQADLHFENANRWFVGAWTSTIDLNPGPGPTLELNAYAGRNWPLGTTWSARLTAVHYAYPNDTEALRYDYDELIGSLAFRDRLSVSVAWSPNTSRYSTYGIARDRTALNYDLVGQWPLAGPLTVAGGVGYYDLDDLFDTGYGYWNASLVWAVPHLQFELGFYSTSSNAEALFGREATGQRWSLTATWQFPSML
jgi:uncharacterized protein (TIGR02001 family)